MRDATPTERPTDAASRHDADLLAVLAEADATVAARQRRITPHPARVGLGDSDWIVVPAACSAADFLKAGMRIAAPRPAPPQPGGGTGAEAEPQGGHHHVGPRYFPLAPGVIGQRAGLLCLNHESVSRDVRMPGEPDLPDDRGRDREAVGEVIAAYGVTVVQVCRPRRGQEWQVAESRYNRQVTGATPIEFSGPVRGSKWVRTKYSPAGLRVRGTRVNGAHGVTPWGTYLACESDVLADDGERPEAAPRVGGSPEQDYRNEPHGFGWVVEIDPFAPRELPRKRTALGRLDHDRAWFAPATPGHPLVLHLGDASPGGCLYRFVTRDVYRPGQTDGNCLDEGTLYVARHDAGGVPAWIALDHALPDFRAAVAARDVAFEDQGHVLVNTRLAAGVVGAHLAGR